MLGCTTVATRSIVDEGRVYVKAGDGGFHELVGVAQDTMEFARVHGIPVAPNTSIRVTNAGWAAERRKAREIKAAE